MGRFGFVLGVALLLLVAILEKGRRSSWRSSPMDFKGKRVMVTGSSAGLGQQLALDLCGKGASVILVARRLALLESTKEKCLQRGGTAEVFVADMNSTDSINVLIKSVTGNIDVLLLNHGVGSAKRFVDLTPQDLDSAEVLFRINLFSYMRLVKGFLDRLNRGGSVVAIGSMAGAVPAFYRTIYSPSKFAIRTLWAGLRLELAEERDLHFTHVLPGYVLTDLHDNMFIGSVKRKNLDTWISKEDASARILFGIARGDREVRLEWLHEISSLLLEGIVFTTSLMDNMLKSSSLKSIEVA